MSTRDIGIGRTTRDWDAALHFVEGYRANLMIAAEVTVSQSQISLPRAISRSLGTLDCPVGLAMVITEHRRRDAFLTRYFGSFAEAQSVIAKYEAEFHGQLATTPYGPLGRDGVVWFGSVRKLLLETYRRPEEDCPADTLLEPSQEIVRGDDSLYCIF
ncbi:hypothetical protein V1525DRAFT_406404 [Lipomyces kononenkoae]|uniref:Uncharacterized protein n=1 Tax=Lipomyces kononenkoae TaxID=34357 RepID=A0ACC3SYA1_LIPKO